MKTILSLTPLVAAFLAACSERQPATAPTGDVAALATTVAISDRPYTWSMKCSGTSPSYANWSWTWAGDTIAGYSLAVSCDPLASPIGAGGTRPAAADGFTACVNGTCQTWSFDPASAFTAQLKGSGSTVITYPFCWGHGHNGVCKDKLSWTATLTIDS